VNGPKAQRHLDEILSRTAQHALHSSARVFEEADGGWTLETEKGGSTIGASYEDARDSLNLLIAALRR
jgi:hypothetical protein